MTRILCLHGIGGKDVSMPAWSREWATAIRMTGAFEKDLRFSFMKMDDLFAESRARTGIRYQEAIMWFLESWIGSDIGEKAVFLKSLRWYASMPAQYVTDNLLRDELKQRLQARLKEYQPSIVFAHSLGSLVLYDCLRHHPGFPGLVVVTSGSQLGHPAIARLFNDLRALPVKLWINLHNSHDLVFASSPLGIIAPAFQQVETPFHSGLFNHDALEYIAHVNARYGWMTASHSSARFVTSR